MNILCFSGADSIFAFGESLVYIRALQKTTRSHGNLRFGRLTFLAASGRGDSEPARDWQDEKIKSVWRPAVSIEEERHERVQAAPVAPSSPVVCRSPEW